jgi:2-hydroxy-3-oxopropionate reductase
MNPFFKIKGNRRKTMSDKKLVGFIGVGVMGGPMASRLLERGYDVIACDKDSAALGRLTALGARTAATPREVADAASIVFTSLPTPAIFKAVAIGADGIIEGKTVKIMVDLSTVGSRVEKEVAAALSAKGIDTVDAPVSGGAAGAQKGTLAVMVAGKPASVEQVQPMFEIFGKIFRIADEPGQGQLMKLLNNILSSTTLAITAEAYVAGVKGGLDPEIMMSVFNAGSGRSGATQDKFPKHVLPRTFDFGFPISSICKDVGLAVEECQALGVPMWVGNTVRQLWQFALLQDGAQRDMTELVTYVEAWSQGTNVPPRSK